MAIPTWDYSKPNPEAFNPLSHLLSKSLANYNNLTKSSYTKSQQEADILNKSLSPIAQFSVSPAAQGLASAQSAQMRDLVSQILTRFQKGGISGTGETQQTTKSTTNPPGFASNEDIYGRLKKGSYDTFGPGAKAETGRASLASGAKQWGVPDFIAKHLGSDEAAGYKGEFKQARIEAEQRLMQMGYPFEQAHEALKPLPNEPADHYAERVKPLFMQKNEPEKESPVKSVDQKIERDEQQRADAEATAKAFSTPQRKVTAEMVMEALSMGVKTKKKFNEFLEWREKSG